MGADGKMCAIPALKNEKGTWLRTPEEKATEIADTLAAKHHLPAAAPNKYSGLPNPKCYQEVQLCPTEEDCFNELDNLRVDSGTGPDTVPARILKNCARVLARPTWILVMRILGTMIWPDAWREQWIIPIFKKGAVFKAKNYRGVHLTAQFFFRHV